MTFNEVSQTGFSLNDVITSVHNGPIVLVLVTDSGSVETFGDDFASFIVAVHSPILHINTSSSTTITTDITIIAIRSLVVILVDTLVGTLVDMLVDTLVDMMVDTLVGTLVDTPVGTLIGTLVVSVEKVVAVVVILGTEISKV